MSISLSWLRAIPINYDSRAQESLEPGGCMSLLPHTIFQTHAFPLSARYNTPRLSHPGKCRKRHPQRWLQQGSSILFWLYPVGNRHGSACDDHEVIHRRALTTMRGVQAILTLGGRSFRYLKKVRNLIRAHMCQHVDFSRSSLMLAPSNKIMIQVKAKV
jgi:hypothetical protein